MIVPLDVERVALLGWRLHPTSRFSRDACFADAATLATCDLNTLDRWARQYPGCGWRVVMEGSAIWALDVDVPSGRHTHNGVTALRDLIAVHGPLPPRPTTRSGGGLALFFKHKGEPIVGNGGHPALGIDPRRGRQSVTIPLSLHPDTRRPYRWLMAPWELAPPPAPDWLLGLLAPPRVPPLHEPPPRLADATGDRRRYALAALWRAADRTATAPQGQRNDTLNSETFSLTRFLADGTLDAAEVATAMAYAARQAGLLPPEVKGTLASALAAGLRR